MRYGRHKSYSYSNDPRWIIARRAGVDARGQKFDAGDTVYYYPLTKVILTGEAAKQAAREFQAALDDEVSY